MGNGAVELQSSVLMGVTENNSLVKACFPAVLKYCSYDLEGVTEVPYTFIAGRTLFVVSI